MRLVTLGILAASLLVAGSASAAEGKGETGGKGGGGPSAGGEATGGAGGSSGEQERFTNPDYALQGPEEYKRWEIYGSLESHRLIRQEDLGGDNGTSGSAKYQMFNYLLAGASYDLTTSNDRIGAYGGVYQFFLADPGESGYRADDILVYYTHYFYFKDNLTVRVRPSFSVPISWESQRESAITDARLTLGVEKIFFDYLSVDFRVLGDSYIDHYTTVQDGATANPKWRVGGILEAELSMPFHRQLSLGADVTDEYLWYYNPGSVPNPQMSVQQQQGAVADPQFPGNPPVQQSYGGEVFVRYLFPSVGGIRTDLLVAVANGDPTLGFVGANHDGVTHVYLGYRDNAEVYAALTARY